MKRLLDDRKAAAEGVADGNERDVLERRQAAVELAGGQSARSRRTNAAAAAAIVSRFTASTSDGRELAPTPRGSTAITRKPRSVMCSAKLYPGWPGMCMSQYALLYEPPGQHTRTARGGPSCSGEGTWTVADNVLVSSANGRTAETSTASSTGWAIGCSRLCSLLGISRSTAGAGLVETGAGRRDRGYLPQSFFHCSW